MYGHLRTFSLMPLLLAALICFGVSAKADDQAPLKMPPPKPDISGHLPEAPAAPVVANEPAKAPAKQRASAPGSAGLPIHSNIVTTWFYVGEPADSDDGYIANDVSAWDDSWEQHFGGVDDPGHRNGFLPAGFTPRENAFYFALPYNDLIHGNHKASAQLIPWFSEKTWGYDESALKNHWLKITKGGKSAYAQWEDAGPHGEDDASYVFGSAKPLNTLVHNAGLDVSPAVRDFLGLSDIDRTSWQFVDSTQVPAGPWRDVVTVTPVSYQ